MKCFGCETETAGKPTKRGNERLPNGWKEWPEGVGYCGKCWHGRYAVRAVTLAVGGPADGGNPTQAQEAWQELRETLRHSWDASTRLANWSVTQMLTNDRHRQAADAKLQPMPPCYLYGLFGGYAGRGDWDGAAAAAQSLMRSVEANYRARRFAVLWDYSASAQSFRWPVPFPLHEQNWSADVDAHGTCTATLRLPGGPVVVRIGTGGDWRYQRARFAAVAAGAVKRCEAAIYARRVKGNDRRGCVTLRHRDAFGQRVDLRVMLKLVAWFPRQAAREMAGVLRVTTGNDALLVAEQDGQPDWRLNADHIRQRVIGHAAYLRRAADDTKYEKRWPAKQREFLNRARDERCRKHADRIGTFIDEATKIVAGLAERRRVAAVEYDDSERGFLPSFPYHRLKEGLRRKLDDRRIEFTSVSASGEMVDETPGLARVSEGES